MNGAMKKKFGIVPDFNFFASLHTKQQKTALPNN
jgi:hypothetical protein